EEDRAGRPPGPEAHVRRRIHKEEDRRQGMARLALFCIYVPSLLFVIPAESGLTKAAWGAEGVGGYIASPPAAFTRPGVPGPRRCKGTIGCSVCSTCRSSGPAGRARRRTSCRRGRSCSCSPC